MKIKNILLNFGLMGTLSTALFSCSNKESSLGMFGDKSDKPDKQNCTKTTTTEKSRITGEPIKETTKITPCDKPDCPAKKHGF